MNLRASPTDRVNLFYLCWYLRWFLRCRRAGLSGVSDSVVNLENSPNQQLTGELTGENISPVKAGEL